MPPTSEVEWIRTNTQKMGINLKQRNTMSDRPAKTTHKNNAKVKKKHDEAYDDDRQNIWKYSLS